VKIQSLRQRTALTIAFWTLVFQVLAFGASAWLVLWPVLRASVGDLSGLMILSAQTWIELPENRRTAFQEALLRDHALAMATAGGVAPGGTRPSYLPYALLLERELARLTGHPASVTWDQSSRRFQAEFEVGQTGFHYAFKEDRIGTNPPLAALAVFTSSLLLVWAASRWAAQRLTEPLAALESAAQAVGRGETPALPAESGVRELDGLTRQFNAMAREVRDLTQARTTLLAGVSHDLRSPLTRLRMALELARTTPEPSRFDDMDRYLQDMDRLIGDFLDYTRGISARQPEPLPLGPWLRELAEVAGIDAACVVELTASLDAGALRRVLTNLIENALRHAPGSLPELACSTPDGGLLIQILDRGPGIPPADRERVFEPFVRLDEARSGGGSGLGLAIVREICRSHGWRIDLRDRPGGGTIAHLVIPRDSVARRLTILP
jgi:two-component system osmolarity sensor histidine kinase EnvZ